MHMSHGSHYWAVCKFRWHAISLIDTQHQACPAFQQELLPLLMSQHLPCLNFNKVWLNVFILFPVLLRCSFQNMWSFFFGFLSQQDQYVKDSSISISYLWMYHVATVGGQNECINWDLWLKSHLIQHMIATIFCRICSTFWYAASKWIPYSFSSTLVQWIPANIDPISSSTR